jgi:hypothetical protein
LDTDIGLKEAPVSTAGGTPRETYNPWTVVNVVFHHLVDQGLHPTLGEPGHPGESAAALLRALGIEPAAEGDARTPARIRDHLAEIRENMMGES